MLENTLNMNFSMLVKWGILDRPRARVSLPTTLSRSLANSLYDCPTYCIGTRRAKCSQRGVVFL
jgi:hypothetical protein